MRMRRAQQRAILAAMFEQARRKTTEGLSLPEVAKAVGQVRDDMLSAHRQGVTLSLTPEQREKDGDPLCDSSSRITMPAPAPERDCR